MIGIEAEDMHIDDDFIIFSNVKGDPVNHPEHYKRNNLPECKDLISAMLKGYSEFLSEDEVFFPGGREESSTLDRVHRLFSGQLQEALLCRESDI